MAPIALGLEVAQIDTVLQAELNSRDRPRNFACYKGFTPQGRLMVKQNTVAGIHAIGLAVIDRNPVGIELGDPVG